MRRSLQSALLVCVVFGAGPALAEDSLLDEVDATLERLERARELEVLGPVESRVVSRDEALASIMERLDEHFPPAQRDATDRFARRIGIVPAEESYVEGMLALMREQVAGYYDEDAQVLRVLDDLPELMQVATLAHELLHAVQDQHWDLSEMLALGMRLTDVGLARLAVAEGDATLLTAVFASGQGATLVADPLMRAFVVESLSGTYAMAPDHVAQTLWDQLAFPYVEGASFVADRIEEGGWAAVDQVYLDPPDSTEQILHPERWIERDDPTLVLFDVSALLGDAPYLFDILGEFFGGRVLRDVLGDRVAGGALQRAMSGWDGDRIEAWRHPEDEERDVLIWASVWDEEAEAEGFASVAGRLVDVWIEGESPHECAGARGEARHAADPHAAAYVERWGDAALVVYDVGGTVDPQTRRADVERVVEETWRTLRRTRYPDR